MILEDQIFAQALVLAGELEERQEQLLRLLTRAAGASLAKRLAPGLTPEDCRADFIAASALFALAALAEADPAGVPEQFSVGDVTVKRSSDNPAANCLRNQAELMLAPYVADRFSFLGV